MKRLLLFAAGLALAQAGLPDTPAGNRFRAWLDAINSGDTARIEALHREAFRSIDEAEQKQLTGRGVRIAQRSGGYDVIRLERSDRHSLRAEVRERKSGRRAILTLKVEAATPHAIADIAIRPIEEPSPKPAQPA